MSESTLHSELNSEELEMIVQLVYKHTGMTMSQNKKVLLQGRIRPRLRNLGLSSFSEYIKYLEKNKNEVQEFINQVTTNETAFFRTKRIWNFFQNEYLPDWTSKNPRKKLKIWSGAASSGEEIYTIAMCCAEFSKKVPTFDYSILGTDISTQVLKFAELGVYQGKSIDSIRNHSIDLFEKYFLKTNESEFQISNTLKQKVKFATHNLMHPQNSLFDLIFLRNVLIYFEPNEQEIILNYMSNALTPEGKIIIGESESLTGVKSRFRFFAAQIYENRSL